MPQSDGTDRIARACVNLKAGSVTRATFLSPTKPGARLNMVNFDQTRSASRCRFSHGAIPPGANHGNSQERQASRIRALRCALPELGGLTERSAPALYPPRDGS